MADFFKRRNFVKKPPTEKQLAARAKKKAERAGQNLKVRNTKKVDEFGRVITDLKAWLLENPGKLYFDSKIEWFFWKECRRRNIIMELKKNFVLQPALRYWGESVLAIKMIPDFYLPEYDIIVDTKGHATKDFEMKLKMLKLTLRLQGYMPRIKLLQTQADILDFLDIVQSRQLNLLDNVPKDQVSQIAQTPVVPLPAGLIVTVVPAPMALVPLFAAGTV